MVANVKYVINVGDKFTNNADEVLTVLDIPKYATITVQWEDGSTKVVSSNSLRTGKIRHPTLGLHIGQKFTVNDGRVAEIVTISYPQLYIKFEDGNLQFVHIANLKAGKVRPDFLPTIYGVGYTGGTGLISTKNKQAYAHWQSMLRRCYCPKSLKEHPSYVGCVVSDIWLNFTNFVSWYDKQPKLFSGVMHLDKDLLVAGNRVYHPDNCLMLPGTVNKIVLANPRGNKTDDLPRGVTMRGKWFVLQAVGVGGCKIREEHLTLIGATTRYAQIKGEYFKELATKWQSQIDPKAYDALMKYTVEITD